LLIENITIDLRLWNVSGIGTYLQNVVPEVVDHFSEKKFYLLGNAELLASVRWPENVVIISFDVPLYSLKEQLYAPLIIPKDSHLLWWPHWNAPIFYSGPLVTTIYDAFHLRIPLSVRNILQNTYARLFFKNAALRSLMILTISQFSKDEMHNLMGIDKNKIHVAHLGVNDEWHKLASEGTEKALPYIIYVGNVKPHKNLKVLVKAFGILGDKISHKLIIVGKKDGFITGDTEIEELCAAFPHKVEFTGWVEDSELKNYVAKAELMIFPSLYEGFGLPPIEAMACGCPVLCSDINVTREICSDAAGYFDPNDHEELASLIQTILGEPNKRESLIEKGRERAKEFLWTDCTMKTIDKFSDLIA
jgi:glycosyltransferase involved in cell wall biosynthesis